MERAVAPAVILPPLGQAQSCPSRAECRTPNQDVLTEEIERELLKSRRASGGYTVLCREPENGVAITDAPTDTV